MVKVRYLLLSVVLFNSSCFSLKRSAESGYGSNSRSNTPSNLSSPMTTTSYGTPVDQTRTALEMGFDPHNLTSEQLRLIQNRKTVKDLERRLETKKEKENYSKVLPWLKDDEEKIEFLSLPSTDAKVAWVTKKKILQRGQNPTPEFRDLMDSQDIAIGMPMDYVKKSWGDPASIEYSGNPMFHNERWKYVRNISTPDGFRQEKRFVYFESGRVVGWDTE